MKSTFILIAALLVSCIALAQNKCDFAEMQTISDLKKLSNVNKSKLFDTEDGKHVLLVEKKGKVILQKIDGSGITLEKEYPLELEHQETTLLNAFTGKNQLFVISYFYENKKIVICKTIINIEDLSLSGKTSEIDRFPNFNFKLIASPDDKFHVFVFVDKTTKDSALVTSWVYNSEMELQWKRPISTIEYTSLRDRKFLFDNFGNLHTINRESFNFLSISGLNEYNYFITSYMKNGDIVGPIQLILPEGRIYDYKVDFPSDGIVNFAGLYYKGTIVTKGLDEMIFRNGVYGIELDLQKQAVTQSGQFEFDRAFIQSYTLGNVFGQKSTNEGLLYFRTKDFIPREDGGFFVIPEFSVSYEDKSQFLDAVVFSFNKSYDFEWVKAIHKDQRTEGGGTTTAYWEKVGSFFPIYMNDNLYLIYNDDEKNVGTSDNPETVYKWKSNPGSSNIVCIAEISKSGDIKKYILDQEISSKGLPMLSEGKIMKDGKTIYVTIRNLLSENHALIRFK